MKNKKSDQCRAQERGAHLVELSLTISVFLLLVLAIFDFARLMTVQHLLLKGAQDGLTLAERIRGAEIDIRSLSLNDPQYRTFLEAREAIVKVAVQSPRALLSASANERRSANSFIGFRHRDLLSGGVVTAYPQAGGVDALFLRPGESAISIVSGQEGAIVRHPIAISSGTEWGAVLDSSPLMVQLCADVDLLIAGIVPSIRSCQRAFGFRAAAPPSMSSRPPALDPRPPCQSQSCTPPKNWDDDACSCACTNSCTLPKALNNNTCRCECPNQSSCLAPPFTFNTSTCSCECICTPPLQASGPGCNCQCPSTPPAGFQCTPATPTWDSSSCSCVCNLNQQVCAEQGKSFNVQSCSCELNSCSNTCNLDTHNGPSAYPECACTCINQSPCPTGQTRDQNSCQCTGGSAGGNSCFPYWQGTCECSGPGHCSGRGYETPVSTQNSFSGEPNSCNLACGPGCSDSFTTSQSYRCNNNPNLVCSTNADCN